MLNPPSRSKIAKKLDAVLPLPVGEGRGEGNSALCILHSALKREDRSDGLFSLHFPVLRSAFPSSRSVFAEEDDEGGMHSTLFTPLSTAGRAQDDAPSHLPTFPLSHLLAFQSPHSLDLIPLSNSPNPGFFSYSSSHSN